MTAPYFDLRWEPEKSLSLWSLLLRAGEHGGHIAVAESKQSYMQLAERANMLAGGLRRRGLQSGDRIAFVLTDRMEIVELLFAAVRLGAILVPINPFLKGRFMRHQLELSDPAVIVVDRAGMASIKGLIDNIALRDIVNVEPIDSAGVAVPVTAFAELLEEPLPDSEHDPDGSLPMAIMFTSGTTGDSKGCILSRGHVVKVGATLAKVYGLKTGDVMFTALPMFHAAALVAVLMESVVSTASAHMTGGFRASTFMIEAARAGATVALCIGAMGPMLLAQPPRDTDTEHRIRLLHIVPISPANRVEFERRFNLKLWTQSFGQTECMVIAFGLPEGPNDPTGCGRASELIELAILDDAGRHQPPGQGGEIAIRPKTSGAMFKGYWRNAQATLDTWRDLWHHTGDNGVLDENGVLRFLDRKKDSIRRRGENVSSIEVETAILEHPAVQAVAVHAVDSGLSEDEIKACLILHTGQTLTPNEIFGFFKSNLPYFAIPRFVECYTEFPLTESMKVRKQDLRAMGNSRACWDLDVLGLRVERWERRGT
jgi:carnitine-CoA ligase